ncbi:MAG: RloB domain-containing protein [Eubacteriales bacterium]|nr:RloB domain-containing protein [Eubacteriales bacterium]
MRTNKTFYFSVEGENEKWYLDHLKKLINNCEEATFNVQFVIKKDKSPLRRIKAINVPIYSKQKIPAFHIVDYESNDKEHVKQFMNILDELKEIKTKHKSYNYKLGYSNFAFEIWLIMHKDRCLASVQDRSKYVYKINELYGTNFTYLKDNKDETTFKKLLNKISLEDVKNAVANSRCIRTYQDEIGNRPLEYKGFTYYGQNPDLTINECIEIILKECGVM